MSIAENIAAIRREMETAAIAAMSLGMLHVEMYPDGEEK